jgi:triacylglycerol lipase
MSNEMANLGRNGTGADDLPSLAVRLWDPLALREFSALLRDPVFRGRGVPPGDGRPVLLIPGFLAGDWMLRVMEGWLNRVGYRTYLSGIVFNVQHSERLLAALRRKVTEISKEAGGTRVSLVGHSRGGLLAKVLAQRRPQSVEQVITLGSPLADWTDLAALTHHAVGLMTTANQLVYGRRMNAEGRFTYDLKLSPVVPTTSIYTRTDDVVNFRSCLRPDIPSIQVWGSHNGLVVNPEVFRLLGRLLARPQRPPT